MRCLCACISLWLAGSAVAAPSSPSRIVVDDAHLQTKIERPAGVEAKEYRIAPTAEITVDTKGYRFRFPNGVSESDLNCFQIALGEHEQYTVPWQKGQRTYVLSAQTLKPNGPDILKFKGFQLGHEMMLGIGVCKPATFTVVWVGIVRIIDPDF